jgi:hypothetical protein
MKTIGIIYKEMYEIIERQLAEDWTNKELAVYIYSNYNCTMDDAIIITNLIKQN